MKKIINLFHTSVIGSQLWDHPLYKEINWSKVANFYAVVDPGDDTGILYLSHKDYVNLLKVTMSNDSVALIVLARPGDKQMSPGPNAPFLTLKDGEEDPK